MGITCSITCWPLINFTANILFSDTKILVGHVWRDPCSCTRAKMCLKGPGTIGNGIGHCFILGVLQRKTKFVFSLLIAEL